MKAASKSSMKEGIDHVCHTIPSICKREAIYPILQCLCSQLVKVNQQQQCTSYTRNIVTLLMQLVIKTCGKYIIVQIVSNE